MSYLGLYFKTIILGRHPVLVTQPIKPKDWGYSTDGLVFEIFNNYNCLPINSLKKGLLQLKMMTIQGYRLWMYEKKGGAAFYEAYISVWLKSEGQLLFIFLFPFVVFYRYVRRTIKKIG